MLDRIKDAIREQTTEQILNCLDRLGQINGGDVDADKRLVRAALIDVYGEREGLEAADSLMDRMGM